MTEDEWLDACADQPDDDLLRFAFADWLDDRGDADRAEFIRLRVELSRQATPNADKARRATQLLEAHRDAWLGPLTEITAPESWWLFPRGLPEELDFYYDGLRWGHGVGIGAVGARALALTPQLTRLTALNLGWNGLGAAGAEALAASPHLVRLTTLKLNGNGIGVGGVTALAMSPHLARLTALELGNNDLGDASAKALAASHLMQLTRLNLDHNVIGDAGALALASSPYLARLHTLLLWGNRISYAGAEALACSPHLTALQCLDLRHNDIGDAGRRALPLLDNRVLLD